MSDNISREDAEAIISIITRAMEFTVRALAQSAALGDILVEKGLISREELRERFAAVEPETRQLLAALFKFRERFE